VRFQSIEVRLPDAGRKEIVRLERRCRRERGGWRESRWTLASQIESETELAAHDPNLTAIRGCGCRGSRARPGDRPAVRSDLKAQGRNWDKPQTCWRLHGSSTPDPGARIRPLS